MKITQIIGLLGVLSGLLHIYTFMGFGELRYFSLVFVFVYGGLGLMTFLGRVWALYALGIAMLIGGIGATLSFATNTLPEWIRIFLIGIDIVVVISVAYYLISSRSNSV